MIRSEQSGNPSVLVHVDLLRGGDLGQARHGEDIAGQGHDGASVNELSLLIGNMLFDTFMSYKQMEETTEARKRALIRKNADFLTHSLFL